MLFAGRNEIRTFENRFSGCFSEIDVFKNRGYRYLINQCTWTYSLCEGIFSFMVDWCSASTIILLSTRHETSLIIFMYMTLSSRMFSTGHESGRFVPCKALYSDKKFSFAFSSSLKEINKNGVFVFPVYRTHSGFTPHVL